MFVLYRKAGLQVEVPVPGFREPIVGTRLSAIGPDEQWRRGDHGILLPGVYQAAGFGDSSEVPLHLPEDRSIEATALEYVRTHGLIMRRLLPLLLTTDGGLSPWGEDLINGRLL